MKVAVIGAGAAGLASAREFRDRGHDVSVFEQGDKLGGVWAYSAEIEDDPLGLSPTQRIYSSLYENLRTNLPIDLMAFKGFAFDTHLSAQGALAEKRFPHHTRVLDYLERYAERFDLRPLIHLNAAVTKVVKSAPGWQVTTSSGFDSNFDVVAVCSGHFSKPRVPVIEGDHLFSGLSLHSHNYRRPEEFAGKTVAVLGRGASGADIVQELRPQAKKLFWCGFDEAFEFGNVEGMPFPNKLTVEGFYAGDKIQNVDVLLYCTGYEYELPFIQQSVVSIKDNFVGPLYHDIVPPSHPTIGFIGLPFLVVPFPLYAMQAKWFAASIDQTFKLPSEAEMTLACHRREMQLRDSGTLPRHFHRLGDKQQAYYNTLAVECGASLLPQWFGSLASEAQQSRMDNPAGFRDVELSIPPQTHN